MKFRHILAALALSVPALMSAVCADPRIRTAINPDGTVVSYRVHGDEFFHFMTDPDCTRILHRDARGFITDILRDGRAVEFNRDNIMMLADEAIAMAPNLMTASGMQKMATLNIDGRSNYPTVGQGNRSLVVLVEFQDTPFTVENPKDYYTRQLNERGFSDYGACGSALDYYIDASNGLYVPQFDVYGPVKLSHDAAYFKEMGGPNMAELIHESITSLHESGELDLSNYDLDEDGIVDTVFFYYAGYGSADSETETIWPHQYDYRYLGNKTLGSSLKLDGKSVGPYACANELKGINPQTGKRPWKDGSDPWVEGIGVFVHEYGHVLGLPDLYDVQYSDEAVTPGKWDVMCEGSYNFNSTRPPLYSAYEQWVCRWLEFTTAEDATHYDLKALGTSKESNAVRIRIPMSADGRTFYPEYFVLESRDNSNWDSIFPESGIVVWRINYDKNTWINNLVNTKNGSNVEIIYSDVKKKPVFTDGVIYKGASVELVPSKDYTYWKSPVITAIGYDKDAKTGSFDYNMATPTDVFTLLHDAPVAAADGSRAFKLTWDPVVGADSYLLTVRVKNSGRIIEDYDAKDMGKETSVWIAGLSSMQWRLEMEAFVTCSKDGLASTATSNFVTFKPSELALDADDNAVGVIDGEDALIWGGVGCIHAPEGALVFDMAGKRLSAGDLAPGVYIVTFGSASRKVVVR